MSGVSLSLHFYVLARVRARPSIVMTHRCIFVLLLLVVRYRLLFCVEMNLSFDDSKEWVLLKLVIGFG